MLGVYGSTAGLTPFLDTIRDHCMVFTEAYATGPYTQASFPSILASCYFLDFGRSPFLSPRATLISEHLKTAGVVTVAIHSNPYLSAYMGWNRGWTFFEDFMDYDVTDKVPYASGDVVNRRVEDYLARHPRNLQNLFLWVHYMDVHEPYVPRRELVDSLFPSLGLSEDQMYGLFKDVVENRDVGDLDKVFTLKKLYQAKVREVDGHLAKLFDILERAGLLRDSPVIITSDHGEEFGEHGGLSHDGKMYQELTHVPLLIFDLRREKEEICDRLTSSIDIPPTVSRLLGVEPSKAFQGTSLLPLADYTVKGCFGAAIEKTGKRIKDSDRGIYYYRQGSLKIIYHADAVEWEMYDIRQDPGETRNILQISPHAEQMINVLKPRIEAWEGAAKPPTH